MSKPDSHDDVLSDDDLSDDNEKEISEAEAIRLKNIRERDEFLKKCTEEDAEFAEALHYINSHAKTVTEKKKKPLRRKDSLFKFTGTIPTEIRRSSRIIKEKPQYTGEELDDLENSFRGKRKYIDDDDFVADLEEVVGEPRKKKFISRFKTRPPIIKAEDITKEMLENIAYRVSDKLYDSNGTSCHQCRQKTKDQKTVCRNPDCIGVQGQLCGVCINNRYGEDASIALTDPNWTCPVCRGICNCSFCRKKQGKRPTGILAPMAQRLGHSSVRAFLNSLPSNL